MTGTPDRLWWSAAEIAAAGRPGLPGTKRGVAKIAAGAGWEADSALVRRRAGRGGGVEYHWTLLPAEARAALPAAARPRGIAPA